jgi:hypothetical protein
LRHALGTCRKWYQSIKRFLGLALRWLRKSLFRLVLVVVVWQSNKGVVVAMFFTFGVGCKAKVIDCGY